MWNKAEYSQYTKTGRAMERCLSEINENIGGRGSRVDVYESVRSIQKNTTIKETPKEPEYIFNGGFVRGA